MLPSLHIIDQSGAQLQRLVATSACRGIDEESLILRGEVVGGEFFPVEDIIADLQRLQEVFIDGKLCSLVILVAGIYDQSLCTESGQDIEAVVFIRSSSRQSVNLPGRLKR
jgi:hypothetical protein